MSYPVINNTEQLQFEVHAEGETAVLQYRFHEGVIWLMHTEVPVKLEGKGNCIHTGSLWAGMGKRESYESKSALSFCGSLFKAASGISGYRGKIGKNRFRDSV